MKITERSAKLLYGFMRIVLILATASLIHPVLLAADQRPSEGLSRLGDVLSAGAADYAKQQREDDLRALARAEKLEDERRQREYDEQREQKRRDNRRQDEQRERESMSRMAERLATQKSPTPNVSAAENAATPAPPTEEQDQIEFARVTEQTIKQEGYIFFQKLTAEALSPAFAKTIREQGIEKAAIAHSDEWNEAVRVMTMAASDVEEFRRITTINPKTGRTLRPYDPANDQHIRLVDLMGEQCNRFKNEGGNLLVQNGRSFLTREEYFKLKRDARASHWTFTNDQIVSMFAVMAQSTIAEHIKSLGKQREIEAWARKAGEETKKVATPAVP